MFEDLDDVLGSRYGKGVVGVLESLDGGRQQLWLPFWTCEP